MRQLTAAELLDGARPLTAESQQLDLAEVAMHAPMWCAGDVSLVERPCVAIVGTRNVTPDGEARARRLARELSGADIVMMSGLAKGIDTAALTSALDSGGRVVAVIGTPLDKAYPAENKALQIDDVTTSGGHFQSAAAILRTLEMRVVLAVAAGQTMHDPVENPFGWNEQECPDFEPE